MRARLNQQPVQASFSTILHLSIPMNQLIGSEISFFLQEDSRCCFPFKITIRIHHHSYVELLATECDEPDAESLLRRRLGKNIRSWRDPCFLNYFSNSKWLPILPSLVFNCMMIGVFSFFSIASINLRNNDFSGFVFFKALSWSYGCIGVCIFWAGCIVFQIFWLKLTFTLIPFT